jgi:hypothetical protein
MEMMTKMSSRFPQKKISKADFVDEHGKEWFLKKGESVEELKKRAKGEKKDG